MSECVFCGIADKSVPAKIVHEDDDVVAFPDIKPQADVHLLVAPKRHIRSIDHAQADAAETVGKLMLAAAALGRQRTSGTYRLVVNAGNLVEVDHLHVHVLGEAGGDRT
jgi:histidine triad (HIT) family protein